MMEGVGAFWLIQNNHVHRVAFSNVRNLLLGNLYKEMDEWVAYLNLREENQLLREENLKLRNLLADNFYELDRDESFVLDSLKKKRRWVYRQATIINKSTHLQYNYLTIDRGAIDGIREEMAVVSDAGIVGKIVAVSEHFASVMPVINKNFRVSTKFKKNNFYGSLAWNGEDYLHARFEDIPLHAEVSQGDSIVVSGYSGMFPEGMFVGVVDNISSTDGSFYTLEVLLATDFRTLHQVYVVEELMLEERKKLEEGREK